MIILVGPPPVHCALNFWYRRDAEEQDDNKKELLLCRLVFDGEVVK